MASGNIQRVACADAGIVRYSSTSGYGFAWGQDVYWLNGDNSWQKVDQNGNTTNLSAPNAPSIQSLNRAYSSYVFVSGGGYSWNVTPDSNPPPVWNNVSGSVSRTCTFSSSQNWAGVRWLWFPMRLPQGAEASLVVAVNGNDCPTYYYRPASDTWIWVWADVSDQNMAQFQSFGFRYAWSTSHSVQLAWVSIYGEYGVPTGKQVYVATVERNGVESAVSSSADVVISPLVGQVDLGSAGAVATITGVQNGDTVRLYRAIEGIYYQVASGTTTTSSITLYDKGDVGEPYRPSGILPYGPAIVVGNRVAVAVDRVVYLSQPGNPVRFGTVAINEDNQDAFSVVLPESVVALAAGEGAVIAHTKSNQYAIKLVPTFDNELLHCIPPMKVEAPTARSHRAVCGSLLVDAEGNVWAGSTLLFSGVSGTVHCLQVDGRLYIATGNTVYVSKPSWKGWVEYTLPSSVQWMDTDGSSVYVATSTGLYKLEGSTSRKASCTWRTGKLFGDRLSAVRYVHIAGTSATLKLIRPGKADVVMSNVTGRVHVPAGEQTHEWQLEFNVSTEVYQIHLTSEGGIR